MMRYRLDAELWSHRPATLRALAALTAAGHDARLVGGAVRDALIGLPLHDIDIGTTSLPDETMAILEREGFRVIPTGIAYGTVTALLDDDQVEVTTLRRDVVTDGRRATVIAYTRDWREDAARRDFTFNAISAEADGRLHDYMGGEADLAEGRVRFIGDPVARIREDYLRILRFFRMHAYFGVGVPHAEALAAIRAERAGLRRLSRERVGQEIVKLLKAPPASLIAAWRVMIETGVVAEVLPEATDVDRLAAFVAEEEGPFYLGRLAALGVTAAEARQALALSRDLEAALAALVEARGIVTPAEWRDWLYRHQGMEFSRRQAFTLARLAGLPPEAWTRYPFDGADHLLPVRGADLKAMGLEGPAIGAALKALERWWLDRDFAPGREECLAFVRDFAARGKSIVTDAY